ncbi:MAG: Peptide methionine sulfoxide reductase MsrA 1 [Candidatus Hydrogenedentes bacterium ADurb.Bin170]|nr:MAG: Peptide methionine sulfoxide reductase MsrA 1 [Candidatus Hydrogenedentes bacterium ADurb.Bin170]
MRPRFSLSSRHSMLYMLITLVLITAPDIHAMNPLTPEEEYVIVHKGTERPFSGKYNRHFEKGVYHCRRCSAPLFNSSSKFEAGCGWPSFDEALPGAVQWIPDADGRRTEILCARCGAHLGHVFQGEGFTPKNTRHCVNSVSLDFQKIPATSQEHRAVFAGGCFWGVEYYFQSAEGVLSTRVGYTGGHTEFPDYEQVCRGTTGHVEAIEILYDPARTDFEKLARLFFEIHDPTQTNGQGPDQGEQYRSVIFYQNEEQRTIAEKLIAHLRAKGFAVATALEPASAFWPAEDYHQRYYERRRGTPYCHIRTPRFE